MKAWGFLDQVLLSHDGNSYRLSGREPRKYEALFTDFIPMLTESGFSQEEVELLTVKNPARAFTVSKRLS